MRSGLHASWAKPCEAKRPRVFAMHSCIETKQKQYHIFSIQGIFIIVNEAFTRIVIFKNNLFFKHKKQIKTLVRWINFALLTNVYMIG